MRIPRYRLRTWLIGMVALAILMRFAVGTWKSYQNWTAWVEWKTGASPDRPPKFVAPYPEASR